ncbi:collagen alpha-1(XV) chain-like [Ctenocephalides felis]|nr:collagen alpha-1(XV) chain-like [Ctenocephalides felis]
MKDSTWPQKVAWHGSSLRGELNHNAYCDAWHSASASKVGLAGSLLSHQLLKQERYSCDNRFVLLCVEATTQLARRRRSADEFYGSANRTHHVDAILSQEEYEKLLSTILDDSAL